MGDKEIDASPRNRRVSPNAEFLKGIYRRGDGLTTIFGQGPRIWSVTWNTAHFTGRIAYTYTRRRNSWR